MKKLRLIAGITGILLFAFNVGADIVTNGLVSWWKFEGSANPMADTVGSNSGTYNGSLFQQPGYRSYCLGFNGTSNNVTLANTITLSEITVESWINSPVFSPSYYNPIFSNLGYNNNKGYLFSFISTLSDLRFYIGNTNQYVEVTSTGIAANAWCHIAATYSDSAHTAKVYINGILKATKTGITTPADFSGGVPVIGKFSSCFYNGAMDEIRIYNRALSDTEILQNYNAPGFRGLSSGILTVDSSTLQINIQGGGIVYLKTKPTGEVYANTSSPWSYLDGMYCGMWLNTSGSSRKYPSASSSVTWAPDGQDPNHHGTLTYTGLTNGVTGDQLSYDIKINDSTGEIALQATGIVASGQLSPLQLNLPLVNLNNASVVNGAILGDGERYASADPGTNPNPTLMPCTTSVAYGLYSPNAAVVEAANSCVGLWEEDQNATPVYNPTTITLLHNQNSYDSLGMSTQIPSLYSPPGGGDTAANTSLSSGTWRMNYYPTWLDVVRAYRTSFESRTGATPLWNQTSSWISNIHAVHCDGGNISDAAAANTYFQSLNSDFSDKLLFFYWNGSFIVLFGDPTYCVSPPTIPTPAAIDAIKNRGMYLMGYYPYKLAFGSDGAQQRITTLGNYAPSWLPSGYTFPSSFHPVYPGGNDESGFYNYIQPFAGNFYDPPVLLIMHPGNTQIRDYLLTNFSDYCTAHRMDGAYMDTMGGRCERYFQANVKIQNGMTHQAGEVFVNTALRNTYPNLGLMSEKQSEWVVPNIFYTWEGFYHFSFPTVYTSGATKLNHPLRTALWGSYNWTKDAPAEDYCFSALMGSLPQLVLGNDWSHARAKFFTDNGLYNDIPASPATWDANNIFAYYRGNNGAHYQYQNLYSNGQLYGEGYVNVSSGAIALGRFKNQSSSMLGAAAAIQDWPGYGTSNNPIGLDPQRAYPFIPGTPAVSPSAVVDSLPTGVYINAIRHGTNSKWTVVEFATHNAQPVSGQVSVYFAQTCQKVCGTLGDSGPYAAGTTHPFDITVPGGGVPAGLVFEWVSDAYIPAVVTDASHPNTITTSIGNLQTIGTPDADINKGHITNINAGTITANKTPVTTTKNAICIGYGRSRGFSESWVNLPATPCLKFYTGYEARASTSYRIVPLIFSVQVNGSEVWWQQVNAQPSDWSFQEIDLSSYAGRKVLITLSAQQLVSPMDLICSFQPALFGNVYVDAGN